MVLEEKGLSRILDQWDNRKIIKQSPDVTNHWYLKYVINTMKLHVTYTSQWSFYCWSFSVKVKFRVVMHMLGHAVLRRSMEICVERVAANAIVRRGRAGAQISSTIRFISHLARPLAWSRSTRLPPLELRHRHGTWNASCHCIISYFKLLYTF